jgi:DNA-directed RNA polymerase subunit RPC12/RpoP
MKFLCMSCEQKMHLVETIGPRGDSGVSVVYECPSCSHRMGMVTNRGETQIVSSLGLQIGGKRVDELAAEGADEPVGCPFGDTVTELDGDERPAGGDPQWTSDAVARLEKIPEQVRPMAKLGIELYARSHGIHRIDQKVLDEARQSFGM